MKEFYVINASEEDGVPHFFDMEWKPQLPEFNQAVANPSRSMLCASYQAKVDLDKFDADAIFEQYIASSDFIRLCESYKCSYFSAPPIIELRKKTKTNKSYNFLCITSRRSILDIEKSRFTLMSEELLRPEAERRGMTAIYDRIDEFAVKPDIEEDLLYCEELRQMVCSSDFKNGYLEKNLIGLDFQKIDDTFVYSPWSDS